ncbi:hypothetical protein [Clostridium thermobutyricum]|nr:hypothetical protein [Clostridium thermobutyricum]
MEKKKVNMNILPINSEELNLQFIRYKKLNYDLYIVKMWNFNK